LKSAFCSFNERNEKVRAKDNSDEDRPMVDAWRLPSTAKHRAIISLHELLRTGRSLEGVHLSQMEDTDIMTPATLASTAET